jgi:nucleoid-associated protein YejK
MVLHSDSGHHIFALGGILVLGSVDRLVTDTFVAGVMAGASSASCSSHLDVRVADYFRLALICFCVRQAWAR